MIRDWQQKFVVKKTKYASQNLHTSMYPDVHMIM